jgi:hypothetical protein
VVLDGIAGGGVDGDEPAINPDDERGNKLAINSK